MYDDQQRRLDALHRLAQEQLRAQKHDEDLELVVEPLTPGIAASSRMRRRSRRGLLVALITGLTLLGLVVTGSFNWRRFLPAPTPTATPITGNELIVTSNANFGSVTLNGKAVSGAFPLLVRLNPGENTITFSAPPFRDRTCHVTLLPQPDTRTGQRVQSTTDGCSIYNYNQQPPQSLNGIAVNNGALVFSLTGADLPDAARNAAESALWAKLASPPTFQIPAGDYYTTGVETSGRIRSARAAVPLLAAPALARASATQNGVYCFNLGCPGEPMLPDQAGASTPAGVWLARESLALGWRFTTRSGALVATSPARDGLEVEVGLTYSPTAGWGVTDGAPSPFIGDLQTQLISASCQSGSTVLQALVDKSSLAREQLASGERGVGGPIPAQTDGCALKLESVNDNPLSPSKEYGHYVWRWGVLLAADTQAHALFPMLPVAPQSEIDTVGGIAF
jgi:hypothetical protein